MRPASAGGRPSARLTGPVNGCAADRLTTITPTAAAKKSVSGVLNVVPAGADGCGGGDCADSGGDAAARRRGQVSAGWFMVRLRKISIRRIVGMPTLCDN